MIENYKQLNYRQLINVWFMSSSIWSWHWNCILTLKSKGKINFSLIRTDLGPKVGLLTWNMFPIIKKCHWFLLVYWQFKILKLLDPTSLTSFHSYIWNFLLFQVSLTAFKDQLFKLKWGRVTAAKKKNIVLNTKRNNSTSFSFNSLLVVTMTSPGFKTHFYTYGQLWNVKVCIASIPTLNIDHVLGSEDEFSWN